MFVGWINVSLNIAEVHLKELSLAIICLLKFPRYMIFSQKVSKHFYLAWKNWKRSKQMPVITNYYSDAIFERPHTQYWYKTVHLLCDIHWIHCKDITFSEIQPVSQSQADHYTKHYINSYYRDSALQRGECCANSINTKSPNTRQLIFDDFFF